MKNTFYLFVITIVLVLSSCKGNSFLSRKYTHFSNTQKSHKITQGLSLQRNQKVTPSVVAAVSVSPTEKSGPVSARQLSGTFISPAENMVERELQNAPTRNFRSMPLRGLVNNIEKSGTGLKLNFQKKDKAASRQSFKAIIGEIIGLVTWIILLAVLVCAVIILVLIL